MTYIVLYFAGIGLIWWVYSVGWLEALKTIVSVLIPSILIILFNIKVGRLLFRNPFVGVISIFPTAIFIYRGSRPVVFAINRWIDRAKHSFVDSEEVIDVEVTSND